MQSFFTANDVSAYSAPLNQHELENAISLAEDLSPDN
jgi:hypothetical protein